jgi:hypothetical protein
MSHVTTSSWLQIQRSRFDSRRYQIFWDVLGLERGPLSLVSTIEELLGRKNYCSGLETENTAVGIRHAWLRETRYPLKLALTSPTSGGRSVDIVRSRTKATEFVVFVLFVVRCNNSEFSAVCILVSELRDWEHRHDPRQGLKCFLQSACTAFGCHESSTGIACSFPREYIKIRASFNRAVGF